jgi:adenylate cyclase
LLLGVSNSVEGERLYGDGVNIAARLEGLAEPGGICISGTVYDQVENKLALRYEYVGEQTVKNIAKPVRVWRVQVESQVSTPPVSKEQSSALPLPDKPSIAVLPFTNLSGDPEQEYFSDGMTDTLITDLSKLPGLFVIARHSVFTYKGKAVKVQGVTSATPAGRPARCGNHSRPARPARAGRGQSLPHTRRRGGE